MRPARRNGPATVVSRKSGAKPKVLRAAMTVILRDIPAGFDWGWFSREDQRMHLQTVDRKNVNLYKVWLERSARRVFEPANKIPAKVLKRLESEVQSLRSHIEGRWVNFMIDNGWVELHVAGTKITVIAYPGTPNRFSRVIDLRDCFRKEALDDINPEDIVLSKELPAIEIWPKRPEDRRHHFRLSRILWGEDSM